MKNPRPSISIKKKYSGWKFLIESGKQFWEFSTPSSINKKSSSRTASTQELELWQNLFTTNISNPNPKDTVYRTVNKSPFKSGKKTIINTTSKKKTAKNHIVEKLTLGWNYFFSLQNKERGSFPSDYGGPLFLLPGLVLFSVITGYAFNKLQIKLMIRYILNHQNSDGGWGLHIEGESLMFTTVLNYVSLRLWGEESDTPQVIRAREWIISRGGATEVSTWGKVFLSVLGLYEWEGNHSWLPEAWLLPRSIPLSPHNYWCHARMVYLPLSYLFAKRFNAINSNHLNSPVKKLLYKIRNEIYPVDYQNIKWEKYRSRGYKKDVYFPLTRIFKAVFWIVNGYEKISIKWLRKKAIKKIITLIHEEDEKTNYLDLGPINKIYNALVIFLEWQQDIDNEKKHLRFKKHSERIADYLWLAEDGLKMKGYTGSDHWDVVFALRALFDGSVEWSQKYKQPVEGMTEFLVKNQLKNGGWGFCTVEQDWPVSDCSAEGLHCLLLLQKNQKDEKKVVQPYDDKVKRAVDFLLNFQNPDGGWPSYEKCRGPRWLEWFNSSMVFGNIMIDYSYVECSASTLQALIEFSRQYPNYKADSVLNAIKGGCKFVLQQQKPEGSWYGSWGVCFTYGTFFAVKGLSSVLDFSKENHKFAYLEKSIVEALTRAAEFFLAKQDVDGSWGESPASCYTKTYHHLPGQVVHTSWATLGLNAIIKVLKDKKTESSLINKFQLAIDRGIQFLLDQQLPDGDWPTQGIVGVFNQNCMISYTNFRNIFPLWAITSQTAVKA